MDRLMIVAGLALMPTGIWLGSRALLRERSIIDTYWTDIVHDSVIVFCGACVFAAGATMVATSL